MASRSGKAGRKLLDEATAAPRVPTAGVSGRDGYLRHLPVQDSAATGRSVRQNGHTVQSGCRMFLHFAHRPGASSCPQ